MRIQRELRGVMSNCRKYGGSVRSFSRVCQGAVDIAEVVLCVSPVTKKTDSIQLVQGLAGNSNEHHV